MTSVVVLVDLEVIPQQFFQTDSDILLWDPGLVALWLHHLDSFGQTVTNQTALEFFLICIICRDVFFFETDYTCLVVWNIFFSIQLGMSSSQLTFHDFSEG